MADALTIISSYKTCNLKDCMYVFAPVSNLKNCIYDFAPISNKYCHLPE